MCSIRMLRFAEKSLQYSKRPETGLTEMRNLLSTLTLGLSVFTGPASAQPDAILILTTYPATGSSSTATTIIAPKLEEYLGREVAIDYGVGLQVE